MRVLKSVTNATVNTIDAAAKSTEVALSSALDLLLTAKVTTLVMPIEACTENGLPLTILDNITKVDYNEIQTYITAKTAADNASKDLAKELAKVKAELAKTQASK